MDIRKEFTIKTIKRALLDNLNSNSYSKISVGDICKSAGIHRSTFYLHFRSKNEVLDALLEEVFENIDTTYNQALNKTQDEKKKPLCTLIRENKTHRKIFTDSDLSDYVVNKLFLYFKEISITELKQAGFSKQEAEGFFWYHLHGCYALIVKYIDQSDDIWELQKQCIDSTIAKIMNKNRH